MEINYFWAQLPPAIDTERCQAPVDSARFILAWQMQFYKHAFRDLREQRDAPQAWSHAVHLLPTSWHPWNDRFLPSLFSVSISLPFLFLWYWGLNITPCVCRLRVSRRRLPPSPTFYTLFTLRWGLMAKLDLNYVCCQSWPELVIFPHYSPRELEWFA